MKIKGEYVIRRIGDDIIAIPVGGTVLNANILIMLNESGLFLWKLLEKGAEEEELAASLCNEYETDSETAVNDVRDFVSFLKSRKVEIE